MREQIIQFLANVRTGKKSDKAIRELVAVRFNGQVVSRYVKIDGIEYLIQRNPDRTDCGFDVRAMDWNHGNDWRFSSPY